MIPFIKQIAFLTGAIIISAKGSVWLVSEDAHKRQEMGGLGIRRGAMQNTHVAESHLLHGQKKLVAVCCFISSESLFVFVFCSYLSVGFFFFAKQKGFPDGAENSPEYPPEVFILGSS